MTRRSGSSGVGGTPGDESATFVSSRLDEATRRLQGFAETVEPFAVALVLVQVGLRGTQLASAWWLAIPLAGLSTIAIQLWRWRGRPTPIVMRNLIAVAALGAAAVAFTDYRLELIPELPFLVVLAAFLLGLRRAAPLVLIDLTVFGVVSWWIGGPLAATFRVVPALLGAIVAGAVADALGASRAEIDQQQARAERHRMREAQLRSILESAPFGIVLFEGGRRTYVNQRAAELTGLAPCELMERGLSTLVGDEFREPYAEALAAMARGESGTYSLPIGDPRGAREIEGTVFPVREHDELLGSVVVLRDVSAERARERMLERFLTLAEATPDVIGMADPDGTVLYLNPAGRELAGVSGESLASWDLLDLVPADHRATLTDVALQAVARGEVWQGELDLVSAPDGRRVPVSSVAVGLRDDEGRLQAFAAIHRDLSDRKRLESHLAHAASHDALTGLPNRQRLFEVLGERLATGAPVTVLFVDLDDFKVVNDSLGHGIGDSVLKVVAERLGAVCRLGDVVGRIGGDEFLVVCPGLANEVESRAIAGRMLAAVSSPVALADRELVVSATIGIAMHDGGPARAGELVQEADIAMYRAKRGGRGRVEIFDETMRTEVVDRLELERDLRLGLERDELELRYQPVVRLANGHIVGFEALVRWRHPTRGLLTPDRFLPIADEAGLSAELGEWVAGSAVRGAAHLRVADPTVRIGVNMSPAQLLEPNLAELIAAAAGHEAVATQAIVVEVTEHAVMSDLERAKARISELRALGIGISVDDFGTGYSNLASLRRLSVDYLKIDQSFVDGLGTDPGDTQIVRVVLSLATELGLIPIAEGLETEAQLHELTRLGCPLAQGYLLSPPVELDAARDLLERQAAGEAVIAAGLARSVSR